MEKFIGVKIIKAKSKPITWGDHYKKQGWEWPKDKKGADRIGYTVGYSDAKGDFAGDLAGGCDYISWSPEDVFSASYRPCDAMTFGLAIEAMKMGHKVARKGWNGKGMFVYIVKGTKIPSKALRGETAQHCGVMDGGHRCICSHIDMKAADESIVVGWLASQTDILAEDWKIV